MSDDGGCGVSGRPPADMTCLRDLWPPAIFNHMKWFQQDLDLMRKSAKREFSQLRPMPCRFCGKVIRVNMYRHVARLHLDLVQLYRRQRVSINMPHHGLCVGSYGQSRCGWSIPVFQPTYCCLVSWDCR